MNDSTTVLMEPGTYWARSSNDLSFYDLIVQVRNRTLPQVGIAWNIGQTKVQGLGPGYPAVLYGPRIDMPSCPHGQTRRPWSEEACKQKVEKLMKVSEVERQTFWNNLTEWRDENSTTEEMAYRALCYNILRKIYDSRIFIRESNSDNIVSLFPREETQNGGRRQEGVGSHSIGNVEAVG